MEVEQPFDRVKNQRRAFIFITYESEEIVEQVVANPKQMVGGKEVRARQQLKLWRAVLRNLSRFFYMFFERDLFQRSALFLGLFLLISSRLFEARD